MVFDQLLLLFGFHVAKRIVLSCKFTLEIAACLDYLLLNLVPLIFGDAWSKWEISEVTSDTNSGTTDHLGVLWREGWALEVRCIHVTLVSGAKLELVVVFEQWGEECSKLIV